MKVIATTEVVNWTAISMKNKNCKISKQAKVYAPCNLAHVIIDKGSYLATNAHVSYTNIGKFCSIGANLTCGWGIHPTDGISTSPAFYSPAKQNGFSYSSTEKIHERASVTIGNDVFIGVNVTILDGISIGNGAIIGAGSVVSKDIPAYAIAVGCPIKVIKYRFSDAIIERLQASEWWNKDEATLKLIEHRFFDVEGFLNEINNV
jgi:acetyltransferase-like isoleucine patch superfamily enzyme